jgi:hypothetical protein
MRVRNQVFAFALAAAAVTAPASLAHAQGATRLPLPVVAPVAPHAVTLGETPRPPAPLTVAVPAPATPALILPGVEQAITPLVVIGHAWACAVRTVLDDMKKLVDAHKLATEPLRPDVTPPPRAPEAPIVPALRARWTLNGALRDAIAVSPIQVGPVEGTPPLEVSRDTHGEYAVLLGARVDLPWMVP